MNIYFARHVHDWDGGDWIRFLFDRKAVAIQFDGDESWDPEDYSGSGGGKSAIRYLNELNAGNEDAFIFASYSFDGQAHVVCGRPRVGSKRFLSELDDCPVDGRPIRPLKVLFLDDVRPVGRDEFPLAYLLAPPLTTFVRWRSVERVAIPWVQNRPVDLLDPGTYLPASIEVACEEYMRVAGLLNRKILRIGGTMAAFDIVGFGQQGPILAQVKNGGSPNSIINAANRMIDEAGETDAKLYLFCPRASIPAFGSQVSLISVEDALQTLKNSYGEEYLRSLQSARFTSSSAGAG